MLEALLLSPFSYFHSTLFRFSFFSEPTSFPSSIILNPFRALICKLYNEHTSMALAQSLKLDAMNYLCLHCVMITGELRRYVYAGALMVYFSLRSAAK